MVARADHLHQLVEFGPVVHLPEVAQLVEHDVVAQVLREPHEIEVQIDIALSGTAAPIGDIVLDAHIVIAEAVSVGELFQPHWELGFGQGAQSFHFSNDLRIFAECAAAPSSESPNYHLSQLVKQN